MSNIIGVSDNRQRRIAQKPELIWPDDGPTNIPSTQDDPRAILRDMINAGLVDIVAGRHLLVTLEAYRRGVIPLEDLRQNS